jgi:hypothetical protein
VTSPIEALVTHVDEKLLKLNAGRSQGVELGMRFKVLDRSGKIITTVKVTDVVHDEATARQFDPFVPTASLVVLAPIAGAALGRTIGSLISPVAGSAIGAVIGAALGFRYAIPRVVIGMRAVQATGGEGLPTTSQVLSGSPDTADQQ